jgi:hypothetical protein
VAQKVVRQLVDDLDGSPAVATVRFGYAGRDYEIELSETHAAELENFLARYREHAREASGSERAGRRRLSRPSRQPREDTQAIRQWAWDHGYQVSERGRIPTDVVTAYQAAHSQAR